MIRRKLVAPLFALAALAVLSVALPAVAEPKGKDKAAAKKDSKKDTRKDSKKDDDADKDSSFDLAAVKKQLESANEAEVLAGLAVVAQAGEDGKGAADAVKTLLERGASLKIIIEALPALAATKSANAAAAIAPYVQHRIPEVRRAAAKALVKSKGAAAVTALRAALRSKDAAVRGLAASGLGQLAAKDALPDLFSALDHNVGEAAASIGQLCDADDCDKLASRLGKIGFDVMSSGIDQILFRPPSTMSDDQKIRIIGRLRELGTAQVGKYLAEVVERWPKDWSKRVKQSLDAAVKATGGKAGSEDE